MSRLFKLRKVATIVKQDGSGSRQCQFKNVRVIRRHEPVLASPNDQSGLLHCPHDSLQGRDVLNTKSAERDNIPERFENSLMCARRAGEPVFRFDKPSRDEPRVVKSRPPKYPGSHAAWTSYEFAEDWHTRKAHGECGFAPYTGRHDENHRFYAARSKTRTFKNYTAAERIADEMSTIFALCGQEAEGETGKVGNGVAILLRLIGQAMTEHVESVAPVPGGEGGNIFLPFQDRATNSGQKNNGAACATRLPEAGAEPADIYVSVLKRSSRSFRGFGNDQTRWLSFSPETR